jgi:DNA-binding transcriptional regulator GbsR (MarR family)
VDVVEDEQERLMAWVDQVAMYLARDGVAPIAGRILGWLMVCDPAEQSAGQLSDAIGASRASLTMNLRLLTGMGFLTWRTRPGDRSMYYRMADDAWQTVVRRQIAGISSFLDITRHGIGLLDTGDQGGSDGRDHRDDRAGRVRQAHAVFTWMAHVFEAAPPIDAKEG